MRSTLSKALLAGLAICALSAITASAATATEYIYKVAGAKLEAGKTKEITSKAKAGTEFVIKWETLGVKAVMKCKTEKFNAVAKPVIVGGIPGKAEKETIEFGECTATIGGAACNSAVIPNIPTTSELVTVVNPKGKAGKLASLVTIEPSTFRWTECGIFGSTEATMTGTTAALVSPEKVEQATQALIWNEAEEITKVKRSNGTEVAASLKMAGTPVTIDGQAEEKLVSGQIWGAF